MQKIPGGHFYGQFWQAFPKEFKKFRGILEGDSLVGSYGISTGCISNIAKFSQILQCVGTGGWHAWLHERALHTPLILENSEGITAVEGNH